MKKILSIVCFFVFFSFETNAEETLLEVKQQLERINRDIIDLQKEIYKNNKNYSSEINNTDSSQITVFDMRLRDIENELKEINFNYENLAFEFDTLKNFFEELNINFEELNIKLSNAIINNTPLNENEAVINSDQEQKQNEEGSLGELIINSEDLSDTNNDISNTEEEKILQNLSPEEEFQIAFDFLRSQKFEEAKTALQIFIENYPSNMLSGSAHYWLGEIYLLKREYREAALIFAEGYQKYPIGTKAPESLYKLAEALLKIEKKNEACDTMNQFLIKYPDHKLIEKVESKLNEIQCN